MYTRLYWTFLYKHVFFFYLATQAGDQLITIFLVGPAQRHAPLEVSKSIQTIEEE